jgi:hypothetical protein
MPWGGAADAAKESRNEIKTASNGIGDLLLARRDRGGSQENPGDVTELHIKAGKAFHNWAQITEQRLEVVSRAYSNSRNVIEIDEAQALWELLDQVARDIILYVEDSDSLLQDYEPLHRAAAPTVLVPFWERWQVVFDILGAYKDTLTIYLDVNRKQPISEVRNFERDRRTDSREIRAKLREFVAIASPLMQALQRL